VKRMIMGAVLGIVAVVAVMAAGGVGSSTTAEASYTETWGRQTISGGGAFTPPTRLPSTTINGQSFNVLRAR